KEVKGSNEKISEIGEKLKDAAEKLGRKDFPADLAGQLAGLVVPFETGNLDKPGVGSMGKTLKPLMRYTAAVEALNSDREQLKNVLTQLQPQVEKAWKEEKEPVVSYSVIFRPEGSKGMVAELVPNKDPFKIGADFPKEYPIFKPEMVAGKLKAVEKKAKRWEKGDLTASDPIAIPVSPQTTSFLEEKVVPQLQLKVIEQLEIIYGKYKGTPQETQGLLKDGEDLEHELHKVSLAR
ncbi:MAG: formin, partial [Polyangiaceae bacterium]